VLLSLLFHSSKGKLEFRKPTLDVPFFLFFAANSFAQKPSENDETIGNTIGYFEEDLELFNDITLENYFFCSIYICLILNFNR